MFTFTGTVTQNLFFGSTIPLTDIPNPVLDPIQSQNSPGNVIVKQILYNTPISWSGSTPSNFLTLSQLAGNTGPVRTVTVTPRIIIRSGIQGTDINDTATIYFVLYENNTPTLFSPGLQNFTQTLTGNWANVTIGFATQDGTTTTIDNSFFTNSNIMQLTMNVWNNCNSGFGACGVGENVSNFTVDFILNISVEIDCSSSNNLQTSFCVNTCSDPANLQTCFNPYVQLCLVNTDINNEPILFSLANCQTYFENYLGSQGPGPNQVIDNYLTPACTKKISIDSNSTDGWNNQTPTIQKICACHLNPVFYQNLAKQIQTDFPGSQLAGENILCMFPPCATTVYKPNNIGKACLPACISLVDINNNGNVGGITVNQNTNCDNITKKGGGNDPNSGGGGSGGNTTPKSWIDRNWIWIVLGVSILLILIIVIIIIASSGTKKKPVQSFTE